jgi:SAM-dependent methyltransferase
MKLTPMSLSSSESQEVFLIESYIRQLVQAGRSLQILEAGCGQQWKLNLQDIQYNLTGVDLDKAALDIRKNILNDLHEIVLGDLRYVDLGDKKYDVIYNSFVLEHIQDASAVLHRFLGWLKPNGLIIIRIPDRDSVEGFFTRVSPHWFHVLYYRYILGKASAGKPGFAPYPTYYDPVVSRVGIHTFCRQNNLTIRNELGNGYWKPGQGVVRSAIVLFKRIIYILSFGALAYQYTNLLYVLQKDEIR